MMCSVATVYILASSAVGMGQNTSCALGYSLVSSVMAVHSLGSYGSQYIHAHLGLFSAAYIHADTVNKVSGVLCIHMHTFIDGIFISMSFMHPLCYILTKWW